MDIVDIVSFPKSEERHVFSWFGRFGGSLWVLGQWSVDHWIDSGCHGVFRKNGVV